MSTPDKLYYGRYQFFIGNYEKCIETCNKIGNISEAEELEKSYYIYRSMICLGQYKEVMDHISQSPVKTVEMNAINILASYFAFPDKRSEAVQSISLLLNEEMGNTTLSRIIACTIFNNENDYEHAYLTVKDAEAMEELSVLLYTLVRMNRHDLAQAVLKKMQKIDDDHVLCQLASTWVENNSKSNLSRISAVYYDLLRDNQSSMLANNYAILQLQNGIDDPATIENCYSSLVMEHKENPMNETVLQNLIVVSNLYQKPNEEIEGYLKELEMINPTNMLLTTIKNMSARVDELEKEFM